MDDSKKAWVAIIYSFYASSPPVQYCMQLIIQQEDFALVSYSSSMQRAQELKGSKKDVT
jgi:hypothetical protein